MIRLLRRLGKNRAIFLFLLLLTGIAVFFIYSDSEAAAGTRSPLPVTDNEYYTPLTPSSQETSAPENSFSETAGEPEADPEGADGGSPTPEPSAPTSIYTIREFAGIIGVFENGDSFPCMTENVPVAALPEPDRKLISEGVTFVTYKDMISFLQNYE